MIWWMKSYLNDKLPENPWLRILVLLAIFWVVGAALVSVIGIVVMSFAWVANYYPWVLAVVFVPFVVGIAFFYMFDKV